MQVIIKQEPGEVSTQQQQQQHQQMVSTATSQQQPAATAAHQFVAVKGGHMISVAAQKQAGGAAGATSGKVCLSVRLRKWNKTTPKLIGTHNEPGLDSFAVPARL